MDSIYSPPGRTAGAAQILRHLAAANQKAWCFVPLHQSAFNYCSQAFLDFWNISTPLSHVLQHGLPAEECVVYQPPAEFLDCVPPLAAFLQQLTEGRYEQLASQCRPRLRLIMHPIISDAGVPLGRLVLFEFRDHFRIPSEVLTDVLRFQQRCALLSERERQVLDLVVNGYTNREVGDALCISTKTVEKHRHHIMSKLGMDSTVRLARLCAVAELIEQN
jgi:DNA-binding CsgD family transcriptional regulator